MGVGNEQSISAGFGHPLSLVRSGFLVGTTGHSVVTQPMEHWPGCREGSAAKWGPRGSAVCQELPPETWARPVLTPTSPLLACRILRVFWQDFLLLGENSSPSEILQRRSGKRRCPGDAVGGAQLG